MNPKRSSGKNIFLVTLSVAILIVAALIQYFLKPLHFEDSSNKFVLNVPSATFTKVHKTPTITFTPLLPLPTYTVTLTSTSTQTSTKTLTPTATLTPTKTLTVTPTSTTTSTVTPTLLPTVLDGDALPPYVLIPGFMGQPQLFSLDCEARAAVDLAGFFGVKIDEIEFLSLLPRSDDPNEGFVGDINGETGQLPPDPYGVYANPIADLLQNYDLNAYARTNMTLDELKREIAAGRPVMVWVIGQVEPGVPISYTPANGNQTTVAIQEHTVVIIGYDREFVYLIDPSFNQFYMRTIERFLESWSVLNYMAVIVKDQ